MLVYLNYYNLCLKPFNYYIILKTLITLIKLSISNVSSKK